MTAESLWGNVTDIQIIWFPVYKVPHSCTGCSLYRVHFDSGERGLYHSSDVLLHGRCTTNTAQSCVNFLNILWFGNSERGSIAPVAASGHSTAEPLTKSCCLNNCDCSPTSRCTQWEFFSTRQQDTGEGVGYLDEELEVWSPSPAALTVAAPSSSVAPLCIQNKYVSAGLVL